MLIIKGFFRKKTTILSCLILVLIFIILSILLAYKKSFFINYDNNYKNTYVEIESNIDISFYLNSFDNIYVIRNENVENKQDMYSYYIYLKHYYNYMEQIGEVFKCLSLNNVSFNYDINLIKDAELEIPNNIDFTNNLLKIMIIVFLIVVCFTFIFIIFEEHKSNKLLFYFGYSNYYVVFLNFSKIVLLLLVPFFISLFAYNISLLILT